MEAALPSTIAQQLQQLKMIKISKRHNKPAATAMSVVNKAASGDKRSNNQPLTGSIKSSTATSGEKRSDNPINRR